MISPRHGLFRVRRGGLATLVASVSLLTGCTDWAGYDLDYLLARAPFIATMRSTVAFEAQTLPRLPVEGTVPVSSPNGELLPEFTQLQLDSVGATLTNPLPSTEAVRARGAVVFANQCAVCHGAQGEGNGSIVGPGRFPLGPPLTSGLGLTRSDGYLYGIMRVGRGLMPSYGARTTHNDRWAVVHYIRQLQQEAGATPTPAVAGQQAAAPEPAAQEPGGAQAAAGQ